MKTYLISYDLGKPVRNYAGLFDAIKSLAAGWCHPLDSVWLVNTSLTAGAIRDRITQVIDSDDRLFVIDIGTNWGSRNLSQTIVGWLNGSLTTV